MVRTIFAKNQYRKTSATDKSEFPPRRRNIQELQNNQLTPLKLKWTTRP